MRDIIQKLKQIEESQTESAGPQVGDEFGLSFSEDLEISTTITDVLEDGIVVDMDDEALAHVQENGAVLYDGEVFEEEIEEGERHGNDSIYDKCRKGWRKKPGATRGSKGSCIKDDIQTEAVSIDKPADRDNPWYKLALLLSEEGEKIPLKTDEGIKLSDDILKLAGMMNQDQIQSQKGMVAFIKQSSDPKALGEIVNKTIREFKAGREMDRTRVKEPADSDAYQGMEGIDPTTGKEQPKTVMGFNVRSKEDKIKDKKSQIELAKRNAPKSGLTSKDVPQLEKELASLMNEDDMERGMGALDKFRELHRKSIGSNDDEVVLKELIEVINDDALFADEFPALKAFTNPSEFDDSEIVTAQNVPGDSADEKIMSLIKAIGDDSWVDDFAQQLMKDFNMGENVELDRIKELAGASIDETYDDDDDFYEAYGEMWYNEDEIMDEAEYQGRKVKLGKPMQGDVKKFKVYVKDPKTGNVKKVNFGHGGSSVKGKAMSIKKSNPARRKSFRARHNCDNPGPRTKARYWSCRKW